MARETVVLLNSQLQFHLETFSSEHDVIEGQEKQDPIQLRDENQDPKVTDDPKSKPLATSGACICRGGCSSLVISFLAGALLRPTSEGFFFKILMFCLVLAATITVFEIVKKRQLTVRRSMLEKTRENISRVLGSIGAPPLSVVRNTRNIPPSKQIQGLETVAHGTSEWIRTVDKVLEFLQDSTSIKLGLGAMSVNVARVELSSLRRRKGTTSHVVLSKLRIRLLEMMCKINDSLLQICDMESVDDADEYASGVITLAILQRMRQQTVLNLARVLNHVFGSPLIVYRGERIESLCNLISEASAYFSGILDPNAITYYSGVENHLGGHFRAALNDVQSLQTCLHASYETMGCESGKDDFRGFWDETKVFLERIQIAVETISFGNNDADNNDSASKSRHPSSDDDYQRTIHDKVTPREFFTEGENFDKTVSRELAEDMMATEKVLVFSGRGEVKARTKKRAKISKNGDEIRYDGYRNQGYENKLLAELQKHLNSMPKREEENVCLEPLVDFVGQEVELQGSPKSYVDVPAEKDESIEDMFQRRGVPSGFLSELTQQIPILCLSNDVDETVGDNFEHSFE